MSTTRFVLFCDPDFFIVKMGWVQEVIGAHAACGGSACLRRALASALGLQESRTSPASIACLSISIGCRVAWLDFRPDYETVPGHARHPVAADRSSHLRWLDQAPRSVEAPQTTSHRPVARRELAHRPTGRRRTGVRVECLQPVFRPQRRGLPPSRAAVTRPAVPRPEATGLLHREAVQGPWAARPGRAAAGRSSCGAASRSGFMSARNRSSKASSLWRRISTRSPRCCDDCRPRLNVPPQVGDRLNARARC